MKPVQIIVSLVMNDLSHFVHLCGHIPELDGTLTTFKRCKNYRQCTKYETCANCTGFIFCTVPDIVATNWNYQNNVLKSYLLEMLSAHS